MPLRSRERGAGPSAWVKPGPDLRRQRAGVWTADGRWREFEVSACRLPPGEGGAEETLVALRDCTLERSVEEERTEAALVVAAFGAGVLVLDVTGRVLRANPEFLLQLGYLREELVGRSARPLWGAPGTPESYETIFRAALASGYEGEVLATRKDGGKIRLRVRAVAVPGEQDVPVGSLWITRRVE
ncbi:MAG: PAS domain-containing protein [Planctomycetes bacterium]|nr:PAS domain-containing protein [Planctomycetota bacterium]